MAVGELLGENLSCSHKKTFVGEQQRKMTLSELLDQLHVDKCGNKMTKIENVSLQSASSLPAIPSNIVLVKQTQLSVGTSQKKKLTMFSGVVQLREYHVDLQYANLPEE